MMLSCDGMNSGISGKWFTRVGIVKFRVVTEKVKSVTADREIYDGGIYLYIVSPFKKSLLSFATPLALMSRLSASSLEACNTNRTMYFLHTFSDLGVNISGRSPILGHANLSPR